MSGHSQESQKDAPMEAFLHVAHLRMAIQQHIKLARSVAQVGIQTFLKRLIKYHLAQQEAEGQGGNGTQSEVALAGSPVKPRSQNT